MSDFKTGVASDEIEDLSKEIKKEVFKPYSRQSTPALFINGRLLVGAAPLENFVRVIDDELARTR